MDVTIARLYEVEKTCPCCGDTFLTMPYDYQLFCNRCFPVVAKEVFKPENGNLTIKEVKEKIRNELGIV